jgi:4-amino-4-deoxy-L-arabinose transferase-like glycosyltransferase
VISLNRSKDEINNKNTKPSAFLKKNRISILFLLLLTIIVSVITYYRILIQIEIGPVFDGFVFLSNALVYTGHSTGYSDLMRPPLFSFMISLVFRLGYLSLNTIFVLDGVLFVFGVIGLYLLLKIKFNDLESFLGGLLYVSFPIVLLYLGFGFSDLSSVSFSIWAIYFMVLAIRKDSKFFYLAFPFAMFAFLTRYNSGLLIFPILLYILMNHNKVEYKNFILGIVASIMVIVPVFIFFYEKFGNIIYPFISFSSTTTTASAASGSASYNPNVFFFIDKFPAFVGTQGIIIMMIMVLGFVLYLILRIFRDKNSNKLFASTSLKGNIVKIKWIIFVVLGIIFLGSFDKTIYIVSELLFLPLAYLFYDLLKNRIKDLDIHMMVFSWFMVFFIFSSIFVIKDTRYFLLMAPPVAYLMILGLSEISNVLNFKIKNINIVFPIIALILTAIILSSTATQLPIIMNANNGITLADEQVKTASQWIINYDPDYKNKIIYSDLSPNFSWYLHTNVKQMVIPNNNQTISNGNDTSKQDTAIDNYLITNDADYYLSVIPGLNLSSFKSIKQFGNVTIYQRT